MWELLPVTPFHYPVAYLLYKLGARLNLPALVVGSMLPDLEIPVLVLLFRNQDSNRLVLHSLIGALTLGTIFAVAITVLIYPKLTSTIFPIAKSRVKEKCRLSLGLTFSCALGCISHVLLEVANHAKNPIFWPFLSLNETPSPIVPILGGVETASLLIHALMVVLFAVFFVNKRENFWEHLLIG